MSDKFEILSPRDHCRIRPGMYLGSTSVELREHFLMGVWKEIKYIPALSKMIDEIIDNSIDEAIRTKFKFANKIDVSIEGDSVIVTDNGRGIPQDLIPDPETGKKIPRAVAAWTKNNAGTSFGENRVTIGSHGLGSALVNYMSVEFIGKTWQNGTLLEVHCTDGCLETKVSEKSKSGSGTSVRFQPDFSLFEVSSLSDLNTVELIEDRLTSLNLAFPEISFSFNGKKIPIKDLKGYSDLFGEGSVILSRTENLSFFIKSSEDGFRSTSYINGVNTRLGGAYVDFLMNGIVEELAVIIKKKHKIEIAKSSIRNGLTLVKFARNFINPKFDSQTKERLTSTQSSVKAHYEESGTKDHLFFARKIFDSEDIIGPIIEAELAKKLAAENRAAKLAQKKLKKVKVAKHVSANSPDATLCLVEGDSALGFLLKVRDVNKIGAYPLRGVVMNTWDMSPADVLKNKELSELIAILGLDINDPNSIDDMTYKTVATLTDADHDGEKIATLLIAFFYKFWPKLFEQKRVAMIRSPIMISTKGSDTQTFYGYDAAQKFKEESSGYNHRYIKGLGSLMEIEYDILINSPKMDTIQIDDVKYFQMMFGNDAQLRKEFMMA